MAPMPDVRKSGLSQNCHICAVKKGALPWSALRQHLRSRGEALARVGSSVKIKNGGSSNFVDE